MAFRLVEIELSKPFVPLHLESGESGVGLIGRWQDRLVGFKMLKLSPGAVLDGPALTAICDEAFALAVLTAKTAPPSEESAALPSLTIAICTKDRAARLSRLLASLTEVRAGSPFANTEILVVDNASVDDATAAAAKAFADVRYVFEPKAGLNFARNAALANAAGELLAFLDDDVVVDRHWFDGLAKAVRSEPSAGGFSGLVLPFRLDTDAQIAFENRGGFGRGFSRRLFHSRSLNHALHPASAGVMGAGCNMAFDRRLLGALGGFDEALDTGRPLPGGGDLDIFYRVLRSGRPLVYEPTYAVYHEHRETLAQLRHQYWTWGLGMMAFVTKAWRSDPQNRPQLRMLIRWWLLDQARMVIVAVAGGRFGDLRFHLAELMGGVQGRAGEYDRSLRRVAAIRGARS
jgi:glycosyltransferase involved in cell wall biosynthesis